MIGLVGKPRSRNAVCFATSKRQKDDLIPKHEEKEHLFHRDIALVKDAPTSENDAVINEDEKHCNQGRVNVFEQFKKLP